ncbi:transcription initiation protein [Sphingomonas parva]|uniref:Transcription initiation protein n=1 Tax=Sphingomonas parva TaxID=2555898 RepID=A0A4Y8ZQ88_9SPHN|nr:YciI family protein [Sphingomonas parva]TFI58124.1 transcription initiation protein [Sphingomonas parva]
MTKYLISFPADAMQVGADELPAVGDAARAVIEEAKAAGVYVFAGGIDESVEPILVSADGAASAETYPGVQLTGGFAVLELPTREAALHWARKLATACRCPQELRAFMYDPAS